MSSMRSSFLSAVAVPLLSTVCCFGAQASTYYVSDPSNAGLDSANRALLGQFATVFPTIQLAADNKNLAPGDTVYVMNGTYASNPKLWANGVAVISKSGLPGKTGGSENYINFAAYPGHHPVVTTAGNPKVLNAFQINASYVSVIGFEVVGNAQNITLSQATATATAQQQSYQQSMAQHSVNSSVSVAYPNDTATNGNCIYMSTVTHILIKNNVVHDCSASGISAEKTDYLMISKNTVYNTSWWTVYDTSGINIHGTFNSDQYTGYKIFIINNISYNNGNTQPYYNYNYGAGVPTDGNGIIVDVNQQTNDGHPYVGRTLILGNIVYHNGGSGIHAYTSAHVDMINNTAYMNNSCPVDGSACGSLNEGQIFSNSGTDINIYNNIMYAPAGKYAYTNWNNTSINETNNVFYHTDTSPLERLYKPNAGDVLADPQFKQSSLFAKISSSTFAGGYVASSPTDAAIAFRLSANSPARNMGVKRAGTAMTDAVGYDGNVDTAIDIGALSAP